MAESRIPNVLGECRGNLAVLCSYINEATQRLINCGGETGFWGTWHKVVFSVDAVDPYITLPPQYARAIVMAGGRSFPIHNQWYEFLEEGTGPLPNPNGSGAGYSGGGGAGGYGWNGYGVGWGGCLAQASDRNMVATAYDLTPTNHLLRVYAANPADYGFKLLISEALDQNGVGIYTLDGSNPVNGFLMELASPFTTSASVITKFGAVGKSVTQGDVLLYEVDADTGVERLLSRYTPQETNPAYRRYYLGGLPANVCNCTVPGRVQITAMCKVEYRPVIEATDYLLIGNIPALKAECESIRYSEMDNVAAQQMAQSKHIDAVRLLNMELVHYQGSGMAVNLSPFGHAHLWKQRIGSLT